MENVLGEALARFEDRLGELRAVLAPHAGLYEWLFSETDDWADLLTYKLVPHFSGSGCLVAALAGGTNTGKSTVFNLLLGGNVSSIVTTAAATCHPVLAGNGHRYAQCLEGKLVPEFTPRPLAHADDAIDRALDSDTLLVTEADDLPDHLVVMDTPDVDSIEKSNWEVADHIRAAGDVLVAVITGEKYKDARVVAFFREAVASGRMVVPLMNKANPADNFHVARRQLEEFRSDTGASGPGYVIPHDFDVASDFHRPIQPLEGETALRPYLEGLDVPSIKQRVFSTTVHHFADRAGEFICRLGDAAEMLRGLDGEMTERVRAHCATYDPLPGEEVGGLFHNFVQSKRGPVRRTIGSASAQVVRGATFVGRQVTGALVKRATLTRNADDVKSSMYHHHRGLMERIVRNLASENLNAARQLPEPYDQVALAGLEAVPVDDAIDAIAEEVMRERDLSQDFRRHAESMLEAWWQDHTGRRRVLEALDIFLAIMPAAIAAPISVYTGGVGASEAVVVVGPIVSQFVTRVMEYQFGDAMFDFLSPWKAERQAKLAEAVHTHYVTPGMAPLRRLLEALEGPAVTDMRRALDQCRKAS